MVVKHTVYESFLYDLVEVHKVEAIGVVVGLSQFPDALFKEVLERVLKGFLRLGDDVHFRLFLLDPFHVG
jgi:hypothetical protein